AKLFEHKAHGDKARAESARAHLTADLDGSGAASAQLAIEAIFENSEAKQSVYATLESQLEPGAILASNTSSIPLDELRETLARPQNFLGLHFFNPVARMPLVEVVQQDRLDQTIEQRGLAVVHA